MPNFTYVATTRQGKQVKGSQDAENRDQVAQALHDQGLVIITIQEKLDIGLKQFLNIQIGGMPLSEKVIFTKQLSVMLTAGMPLLQALETLAIQTKNDAVRTQLERVYKAVESGASLSSAFEHERSLFSEVQLNLIKAGEKSGNLNQMLQQISIDMEKSKQLRGKVVGAMIYPIIIFITMIVVFVMMLVFMIPSVKSLYTDFGVNELPPITQFLVDLSNTIASPVGIVTIILTVIFLVVGTRYYYTTVSGRHMLDKLLLRLPVFGQLQSKVQLMQFGRLLAMLMRSGIPIVDSLHIVANAMGNILFKDAVNLAATEVLRGNTIAVPLAKANVFPLIMLKMIATGEQTGKLDVVCAEMAAFYEAEVDEMTSNLTRLLEPIILLGVGGVVGFLAVAIYLPLYSIGQYIK